MQGISHSRQKFEQTISWNQSLYPVAFYCGPFHFIGTPPPSPPVDEISEGASKTSALFDVLKISEVVGEGVKKNRLFLRGVTCQHLVKRRCVSVKWNGPACFLVNKRRLNCQSLQRLNELFGKISGSRIL